MKIIHCDIKASNILLIFGADGKYTVKICDFGLSQFGESKTDYVKGTETFIAPEIINNKQICYKTDIWSLGALILHLIAPAKNL